MEHGDKNILLYDGYCLMCSRLVQWVMRKDSDGKIYFAALQDDSIRPLMEQAPDHIRRADSVILYSKGRFFYRSTAILKLYKLLGFPWNLAMVFWIFPRPLRDAVYKLIARYRVRWFGRNESCYLVPEEKRSRFLTDPGKQYDGGGDDKEE